MKASELRDLQAPIKERYRDAPDAAVVTLKATGNLGDGLTCKVETGRALVEAGLHPATGGDGIAACSGDMLLEALVACAGVTLKAVATALDISSGAAPSPRRAISTSVARSEWRRTHQSGSAPSACGSTSIRMPALTSSQRCSSSQSAIAWSFRPLTINRSSRSSTACLNLDTRPRGCTGAFRSYLHHRGQCGCPQHPRSRWRRRAP